MDGFKHRITVTDIGTAGCTHAALNLGCLIGNNIAVQVGQQNHLELVAQLGIDQIGGHNINIPIVHRNIRVILSDFVADGSELAVCLFHNIGLGNNADPGFAVILGILKGSTGNSSCAEIGGHLKVHCKTGKLYTTAAQNILTLGIFPVEHPVDALLRNGHRPHIGIQVKLTAQCDIGTFHLAAHRRGGGAL